MGAPVAAEEGDGRVARAQGEERGGVRGIHARRDGVRRTHVLGDGVCVWGNAVIAGDEAGAGGDEGEEEGDRWRRRAGGDILAVRGWVMGRPADRPTGWLADDLGTSRALHGLQSNRCELG